MKSKAIKYGAAIVFLLVVVLLASTLAGSLYQGNLSDAEEARRRGQAAGQAAGEASRRASQEAIRRQEEARIQGQKAGEAAAAASRAAAQSAAARKSTPDTTAARTSYNASQAAAESAKADYEASQAALDEARAKGQAAGIASSEASAAAAKAAMEEERRIAEAASKAVAEAAKEAALAAQELEQLEIIAVDDILQNVDTVQEDIDVDSDMIPEKVVIEEVIAPEQVIEKKLVPRCDFFTDVSETSEYFDAIEYVRENAIFAGYVDCSFRPEGLINRAEMAKVIVESFGLNINNNGGPHFFDVKMGDWFYDYVETAYNLGFADGYMDGSFRPADTVIKSEVARMFVDASELKNKVDQVDMAYLCDDLDPDAWFAPYYALLAQEQIVSETDCDPAEPATRQWVANLFYGYGN